MSDEITLDQLLADGSSGSGEVVNVDEPMVKVAIFALNGEWYALYGGNVREVLPPSAVFFIPGCPPSLEGVINLRGDIESVLRIKQLLGLPDGEAGRHSSILIGRGGGMTSGIRVDEVVDVVDLPESAIQASSSPLPEPLNRYVVGALRYHDRPVTLLDLELIFDEYRRGLV